MNNEKVNVYSSEQLENIISEFSRLKGQCYLDHAGATLYSEKQLEHIFRDLSSSIYANPHAHSTSSQLTRDTVDIVRYQILNYFNTTPEEYSVIFTSGATQALKLTAESFEFNGGTLAYLKDNHTSVLGMRSFARNFREVKIAEAFNILSHELDSEKFPSNEENCLFVYPAQSNFSGAKYPLSWIKTVKQGGLEKLTNKSQKWWTLLDAASFVSTNNLDLNQYKPDFVAISFYKIFGYPDGLGALLVKNSSEKLLKKQYFGGGTVLMALSSENVMIPRPNIYERFEDGTIPFLSILALKYGFDTFKRLQLTPEIISQHTFNVSKYTFDKLSRLHHSNGTAVAILYHDTAFENRDLQGGIVNFNLKRCSGEFIGFAEVLHFANLHEIQLRTGCFCNPGACQHFLQLNSDDVRKHYEAGHVCGDQHDLIDGFPTGSVRISFGYMSTYEDADRFLEMIDKCFVTHHIREHIDYSSRSLTNGPTFKDKEYYYQYPLVNPNVKNITGQLKNIFLYPVKSCGAYSVEGSWQLSKTGLKYDRKWMIVNAQGSCVSQKQIKKLCTIKPILDFNRNKLKLTLKEAKEISVPIDLSEFDIRDAYFCDSKVCGDKIIGYDCGDAVAEWLSLNLEKPGLRLLRQCDFTEDISGRNSRKGEEAKLSLANKAQYLLINMASIMWLKDRIPQDPKMCLTPDAIASRFRANFVVDFGRALVENYLDVFQFDDVIFKSLGNCTRCQMICIDQETGNTSTEPLHTLSKVLNGKINFGVYLSQQTAEEESVVKIGCSVKAYFQKN